MKDLVLEVTKPHKGHIKITAWLGDLFMGEALYLGSTEKVAKESATNRIKYNGSLY